MGLQHKCDEQQPREWGMLSLEELRVNFPLYNPWQVGVGLCSQAREDIALNCARGGLGWVLAKMSSQKVWLDIGATVPGSV